MVNNITENFLEKFNNIYFHKIERYGRDIIEYIKSKHFHSDGRYKSPHEESLYDHLVLSGEFAYDYLSKLKGDQSWKYYLVGFLHDIGKPGTIRKLGGNRLAMKGHGINGAAMMDSWMFSEKEFQNAFQLTKEDMEDIAAVTNYHMCGYFPKQMSEYHLSSFKACLRKEARELLCGLRVGDINGRKPQVEFSKKDQETFYKNVMEDYNANNGVKHIDKSLGVLISIQGYSGNGKTTTADKISYYLEKTYNLKKGRDIIRVNRDAIMLQMVAKEIMAKEDKMALSKDIPVTYGNKEKDISYGNRVITYKEAYEYYKNNKERLSGPLNKKVNSEINDALIASRVCIVDTMATLSPMIRKDIFPKIAKNCLRIFVWVHRDPNTFTDDECMNRRGLNKKEQISINRDEQDFINPIGYNIPWGDMTSLTEDRYDPTKLNINDDGNFRPHFSLPLGFNSDLMWNNLCRLLKNLVIPRPNRPLPLLNETLSMSLKELVHFLVNKCDSGIDGMISFFKKHRYMIKLIYYKSFCIAIITYLDGINKIWKPVWAREARGRAYAIKRIEREYKVIEVKNSLKRGVELLTSAHLDKDVDKTQDISDRKDIDYLDDDQKEIIFKFQSGENKPLQNCYVSQKVDGSLLVVSVYKRNTEEYDIMKEVVNQTDRMWHVFTNDLLIVPATKGTIKIGEDMKYYALTCFKEAFGISLLGNDGWETVKDRFSKLIESIVNVELSDDFPERNEMISLIFEMVCANRNTIANEQHSELAISYGKSALYLLGMCRGDSYIPHYKFKKQNYKNIQYPLYRKVYSTNIVIDMLKDLDNVFLNKKSAENYCWNWFDNFDESNFDESCHFHAEGFVFLQHKDNITTYSKIKHPLYYIAHKSTEYLYKEIPDTLTEFYDKQTTLSTFPNLRKFRFIHEELPQKIQEFLESIKDNLIIQKIINDKHIFEISRDLVETREKFLEYLAEKPFQPLGKLCKFMLSGNILEFDIVNFTREFFKNHLDPKVNADILYKTVKTMILHYRIWLPRDDLNAEQIKIDYLTDKGDVKTFINLFNTT